MERSEQISELCQGVSLSVTPPPNPVYYIRKCEVAPARVLSRACVGVEAPLITVEVHLAGGLPVVSIVRSISPNFLQGVF